MKQNIMNLGISRALLAISFFVVMGLAGCDKGEGRSFADELAGEWDVAEVVFKMDEEGSEQILPYENSHKIRIYKVNSTTIEIENFCNGAVVANNNSVKEVIRATVDGETRSIKIATDYEIIPTWEEGYRMFLNPMKMPLTAYWENMGATFPPQLVKTDTDGKLYVEWNTYNLESPFKPGGPGTPSATFTYIITATKNGENFWIAQFAGTRWTKVN